MRFSIFSEVCGASQRFAEWVVYLSRAPKQIKTATVRALLKKSRLSVRMKSGNAESPVIKNTRKTIGDRMKRREFGVNCAAIALAAVGSATRVAEILGDDTKPGKALRILLIVGGHAYDRENLHAMLRDFPNAVFREISLPESQDMLKPGLSDQYDVLVFHDQSFFELTQEQKDNMEKLFGAEGIPTIMLHHSLISHPEYPFFRELYGAQYLLKDTEIDGRVYKASSYLHPTDVNIYIVDRDHPITRGISDFKLNDEVFKNVYYNPRVDVLARTDHPEGDPPTVWLWHYKKSPVFGMIQGDAGGAFNDPNYRKIFYQGALYIVSMKDEARKRERGLT